MVEVAELTIWWPWLYIDYFRCKELIVTYPNKAKLKEIDISIPFTCHRKCCHRIDLYVRYQRNTDFVHQYFKVAAEAELSQTRERLRGVDGCKRA